MPFIVPLVATGINIGVSADPCKSCILEFNMIHVMNELSENRFIKPVNSDQHEFAVDRMSGSIKYDDKCTLNI